MEILEEFCSIPEVTFFETGTYTGTGINQATKAGFSRVISLEPVEEFYQNCVKKFSERITNGTVRLVWGSSEDKLYDEINYKPIVEILYKNNYILCHFLFSKKKKTSVK